MLSRSDLYLVTREATIASAVSGALGINGEWTAKSVCSNLHDLVVRLQRTPRAAVVVDIDPIPEHTLSELELVTRRFAEARFIVVSSTFNSDLVLKAMQAGARHYMLKNAIPAELQEVVRRLSFDETRSTLAQGSLITLLSAGGGCGATTLAVNLAAELHHLTSEPTLLVDLDDCYGTVGAYLGVSGQYGIADVLSHPGHIDPHLITSTAESYNPGLHVLLSPASVNFKQRGDLNLAQLNSAARAARLAYGYTVIDAPRIPLSAAIGLAETSLLTLIVLQLNVKDIRVGRALYSSLLAKSIPSEHVMVLANRYRSRHGLITLTEARQALGVSEITCIDNDFKSAIRGADYGKPLAEVVPRSTIRKNVHKLAQSIVNMHSGLTQLEPKKKP